MKINKPDFSKIKNIDWGRVNTYNPFRLLRRPANALMLSEARVSNKIGSKMKWIWLIMFFFAALGPVTHTINTIWDMYEVYMSDKGVSHAFNVYGAQGWLYFTFLANFGVTIYAFMRFMGFANSKRQFHAMAKIALATFITITCLVSWTLLVGDEVKVYKNATGGPEASIEFLSRFFNHLLTPILFVIAFSIDSEQYEIKQTKGSQVIFKILVYPIVWLLIAIIVYYSLGGNKGHQAGDPSDAFYSFLDFNKLGFWSSTGYILGVAFIFMMFSWLFGAIAIQKKLYLSGVKPITAKVKKEKKVKVPKDKSAPKEPSKMKLAVAKAAAKVKSKPEKLQDIKEENKDIKETTTDEKPE